jgi:hypothetical protein
VFEKKWQQAKPLFDKIIAKGVNDHGQKYGLVDNYAALFDPATENNKEEVFAAQEAVNYGVSGNAHGYGDHYVFPYGGPFSCCGWGFDQPTQDLVNSYRTNVQGLPLKYNPKNNIFSYDQKSNTVKSNIKLKSNEHFAPYTGRLDPRLDFVVGRRGLPFLDWGPFPGRVWIREQNSSGPYENEKPMWRKSEPSAHDQQGDGGGLRDECLFH